MTEPTQALRGAVDLTSLAQGTPGAAPTLSPGPAGGASPLLVEATDATFQQLLSRTATVPAIIVLWSSQQPETGQFIDVLVSAAEQVDGRVQVISADVAANPGLLQAFRPPQVPVMMGLVQGQPVQLPPASSPEQLRQLLDELVKLAVQHGVTGRVPGYEGGSGGDEAEAELPPLHQEAYDAIERDDLDAAAAAYTKALAENPKDADAELGLAQVELMRRTKDVDLQAARDAAAADPKDIDAQLVVADLDVLGGHVEDAFTRLIDLVRATQDDERERVKSHLISLFAVVGNQDPRVRSGRTALMSALF